MVIQESIITLSIKEAENPPNFSFHVLLDGEVISSNLNLSPEESKEVRKIALRYGALFEHHGTPQIAAEELNSLGTELFSLWLSKSWDKIEAKVPSGAGRLLVISSDVPDVLNLPWELIRPTGKDFLGIDPRFSIRRFPGTGQKLPPGPRELRPRPLRLLAMACSPKGLATLDYELEEEYLLKAISGLDVAFDSGDLGTFEELQDHVNRFQPHVVHLTGHGAVGRKCPWCSRLNGPEDAVCKKCSAVLEDVPVLGHFAFEDEGGFPDMISSEELRQKLARSGVQCVFVSGCETGKAPPVEAIGGVCQGLVGAEVPLAIGWAASIADDLANLFARTFYRTLAAGQPADRALVLARQDIWKKCRERGDPSWTLPVLYSATDQGQVFDPDKQKPRVEPPRDIGPQMPLPGMIEGYAEHFVGRRREQQRLLPKLRDGSVQTVVITGLGGSGKSSLATRLAWKLKGDGFASIAISSSQEKPLSAARLIQSFGDAFLAADLDDAYQKLSKPEIPADARLRYVVSVLNKGRFLLVLDNFESNMDEDTRSILDEDLAGFYEHLLSNLAGGSRAIVTSRYLPAGELPPTAKEEPLGDFGEASFFKFLRRDPKIEQRYRYGDLSHALFQELYQLFGGTPRFLDQIRNVLREIPAEELKKELDAVKLPDDEPGELQKIRDQYCEEIFTSRLYGYLDPESQRALSRAAVYGVAVNFEGLAAVTGESAQTLCDFAREWQDRAFAYPETERAATELWAVYGLLRGWLLARLGPEDRKAAHKKAGDFLRNLDQQEREGELGLTWVDCLLEARSQYLQAEDYEQARAVTARVSGFFTRSGLYDGVRQLNAELLRYEEHPSPMNWIGRAYLEQSDYQEAQKWYRRTLDATGDLISEETATAWHQLATIDLNRGEYGTARQKFETALKVQQQIEDRAGETITLHNLATIDVYRGEYEGALQKFEMALKIKQRIGDRAGEAQTLHNLATIELERGEYEEALQKFGTALEIEQQIEDRTGEAATLHNLATIDLNRGEYEKALQKFETALEIRQRIGDRAGEAQTWHQLASIDLNRGEYEKAFQRFETALKIFQQIGDQAGEATPFAQLGVMASRRGRIEEGLRLVALSAMIFGSIGHAQLKDVAPWVNQLASKLQYTQEQFDAMRQEVAESYRRDRGRGLIDAAFGED